MENPIDRRGKLDEEVFTYRITKGKRVFISWHGKQVVTLKGSKAEDFIADMVDAEGKDAQLVMAKATGHFKHGNEKPSRGRWREASDGSHK